MAPKASVEHITSQTKGLERSLHSSVGKRMAMQMSTPPMVGVPAFFWCALRTVLADVLADLKFAQLLNHKRPDEQGDQHRGKTGKGGAKRQIPEDAEGSEVGKKFLIKEPVKQTSSADPHKDYTWLSYSRSTRCVCVAFRREPRMAATQMLPSRPKVLIRSDYCCRGCSACSRPTPREALSRTASPGLSSALATRRLLSARRERWPELRLRARLRQ